MALVPAPQSRESLIVRVLRVLLAKPQLHGSIKWDKYRRCQTAVCAVCGRHIGVTTRGNLSRHGPLDQAPCPGTGGATTYPVITDKNAGAAYAAAEQALAGHRRNPRKR
jgi:hypothetical protein